MKKSCDDCRALLVSATIKCCILEYRTLYVKNRLIPLQPCPKPKSSEQMKKAIEYFFDYKKNEQDGINFFIDEFYKKENAICVKDFDDLDELV